MNKHLQKFARDWLKTNLSELSTDKQLIFKRMYSPNNLGDDIIYIVDVMPADKLDWAMQQVQNTLDK